MSDLVEKLRSWPFESGDPINAETSFALVKQAAVEIETLRLQLVKAQDALKACRTSYCGYAITKSEQYPTVLANFWKEIQRIDRIASAALTDEKST